MQIILVVYYQYSIKVVVGLCYGSECMSQHVSVFPVFQSHTTTVKTSTCTHTGSMLSIHVCYFTTVAVALVQPVRLHISVVLSLVGLGGIKSNGVGLCYQ